MKQNIKFLISIVLLLIAGLFSQKAFAETAKENMLIVFDASGSMTETFGGATRISAAKSAISDLLSGLDSNTVVALRGLAQEKKADKASACTVTALLQSFTSDKNTILNKVNAIQAVGAYTPLAYSLEKSASDFVAGQNNVLVLMTDGMDTCDGDPAKAAAALNSAGIKVKTYVIGLGADAKTRTQLSAIATSGGGSYYDANDATSLANSFKAIQELEHPVDKTNTDELLGTEVTGGNGYNTAVPITPGMYHLSHHQLGGQYDYFKMNVKEGDVLTVSIQSSESLPYFDEKTNSFVDDNNHRGSYAGIGVYTATRLKLSYIYEGSPSTLEKEDIKITDTGTIYFLVGNENSQSAVMSKSDIFTIKVNNPNTPKETPVVASENPVNNNPTNSGDGNKEIVNKNNTGATNTTEGNNSEKSTNIWMIVGITAGVMFLLFVIVLVIVFKMLKGKNNNVSQINNIPIPNPVTPVQPQGVVNNPVNQTSIPPVANNEQINK